MSEGVSLLAKLNLNPALSTHTLVPPVLPSGPTMPFETECGSGHKATDSRWEGL